MRAKPKIGLALGGGGARGLAHIGVLKVLEQEDIAIHCLSGSSMGGLLAAAYAAGKSPVELENLALEFQDVRKLLRLLDLNPRRTELIGGKRVRNFMTRLFDPGLTFEQLIKPLALTATDFLRGKPVVIREGNVVEAVMATCAFPGIFEPVKLKDTWMVDGGMLNNVPVDIARQLGADLVIGVEVTPAYPREMGPADIEKYHPLSPVFPRFAEDFYQTALIMTAIMTQKCLEDAKPEFLLRPDMPDDLSIFLGFPRAAEAIAAGEKAARCIITGLNQRLEIAT